VLLLLLQVPMPLYTHAVTIEGQVLSIQMCHRKLMHTCSSSNAKALQIRHG